ncbi:MAG: phasin family protein [Nitrospirae bacterium]|nr:phasin family protein [Nitrospirota bacterium]
MTLFEATRRALLAGLGMQAKVNDLVDELIKKGELSETQGARLIKEWSEKADKSGKDLGKSLTDIVNKALEKMNVPTKDEVERLSRKVQAISARLKKLEEKGSAADTEE